MWRAGCWPRPAGPPLAPLPRAGAAWPLLFVIDLLINKGVGFAAALRASQSGLALNSSTASSVWPWGFKLFSASYLLPAWSLAEKRVGDRAGRRGRRGDSWPCCSIPGSAPNPPSPGCCWDTKHRFSAGFGYPIDALSASAAIFPFLHSCCQPAVCSVLSAQLGDRKKPSALRSKWSLPAVFNKNVQYEPEQGGTRSLHRFCLQQ